MTRQEDYDWGGGGRHGFIAAFCKTDNFKVIKGKPLEQYLVVKKFKDCNANGAYDEGERWLSGWDLWITPPDGPDFVGPEFQTPLTVDAWPGDWSVREMVKDGWFQTALIIDGFSQETVTDTARVTFGNLNETHTLIFGNIPTGNIIAYEFYDSDVDGVWDPDEKAIGCVRMTLTGRDVLADPLVPGDNVAMVAYTGADGCVTFDGLLPGTYVVTETPPATACDWVATGPVASDPLVLGCEAGLEECLFFGNVITGTACFSTKGYWHNKNGLIELTQAVAEGSGVLAYVGSLAPYSSPSNYFDAGDEPFNGEFEDGTSVAAAFSDGIGAAGTWQAEVSLFLVERNPDVAPDQLAQQLLAFIFNVYRLGGESAVILEPGIWEGSAVSLIAEAIAAWGGSDSGQWSKYISILDQLNNRECSPGVDCVFPSLPDKCEPTCPQ